MQLWFYKAKYGDWWDKLISLWTFGPYSHVEIRFSEGLCFSSSSRDNGSRFKQIPLSHKWVVVDIGNDDKEDLVREWCKKEAGKGYYWYGAVALGLCVPCVQSVDKWFCTEIVGEALTQCGVMSFPLVTPNKMYKMTYSLL